MSKLKTIDICAEFGYELACSIPYAYWLHKHGELGGVVTCEGMKPFYYFCDNVEEKYKFRRMDNNANGVQNLPNSWVHHNAPVTFGRDYGDLTEDERIKANGWLDYSQWECPPYREYYKDSSLSLPKKYVVISNRYNLEHGDPPIGHFDIESLYNLFEYFKNNGYNVVYKRPKNTEFATDSNELLDLNITANVEGQGTMTDFDLVSHYDNVFLMDDLIFEIGKGYNEIYLLFLLIYLLGHLDLCLWVVVLVYYVVVLENLWLSTLTHLVILSQDILMKILILENYPMLQYIQ